MKKKFSVITIMLIVCLTAGTPFLGNQVYAAETSGDPVVYDLNQEPQFANRTFEEVMERYFDALYAGKSYDPDDESTYYNVMPSLKNPYEPGELTEDTILTVDKMMNYFRWLVGVEPMLYHLENQPLLQAGALVRNFDWNHVVDNSKKPADMDDELWNYGRGASNNSLSLGNTPHGSVISWMNEGYDPESKKFNTFGHRYNIIDRDISILHFGYSGRVGIAKASAYSQYKDDVFTAFPSPGYVPNDLVYPGVCGWQVEMDPTRVTLPEDKSGLSVTITNERTGQTYVRTIEAGTLLFNADHDRVCFAQPEDWTNYRYADSYHVVISGLVDVATEGEAVVEYTVDFADPADALPEEVTGVVPEFSSVTYDKKLFKVSVMKKISGILPEDVKIYTSKGNVINAKVSGKWTLDTKNNYWKNKVDASVLPDDVADNKGILNNVKITYKGMNPSMNYFNVFSTADYKDVDEYVYASEKYDDVPEGSDVKMAVYTWGSDNTSRVYRIIDNGDKTYTLVKRFDSADPKSVEKINGYDVYTIKKVSPEDIGEYFSVYHGKEWGSELQVGDNIATLKLREKKPSPPAPGRIDISAKNALEIKDVGSQMYTGKEVIQYPDIYYADGTWLTEGFDYELKYENNVKVGKATMIITGINDYKGTVKKTFKIIPKWTSLKSVKPAKKAIRVKWKKQAVQTTGYEIQYSLKKNFKSAKTVRIANNKTTSKKIRKLKRKKTYYVRVRTYKIVNGRKYCSVWSDTKKTKVK